jgi:hypothetical protein
VSTPDKAAPKRHTTSPRTPAAKGRRVRVSRPNPYAVMVYRLSLAVLATIVVLTALGRS